jgi:hypothetical protein
MRLLGVMDVGQAKTRFFQRNSEKNDDLTLYPHKEREFWLWVASWALFVQRPSDLGFDDTGYELPPMVVRWHEVPSDHKAGHAERDGQGRLFRNAAISLSDAAKEKRDNLPRAWRSLPRSSAPIRSAHRLIWHDLERERAAIETRCPMPCRSGAARTSRSASRRCIDFSDGKIKYPRHQAGDRRLRLQFPAVLPQGRLSRRRLQVQRLHPGLIHRIQRFLQAHPVEIDIIYSEAERDIRAKLEEKWARHEDPGRDHAGADPRARPCLECAGGQSGAHDRLRAPRGLGRALPHGQQRLRRRDLGDAGDSVDLIVTSIPFEGQYEYTPSYNDFGHTDDSSAEFWAQMDFLIPQCCACCGPAGSAPSTSRTGSRRAASTGSASRPSRRSFRLLHREFRQARLRLPRRKTIVTDVVRENNQTYRLGWTEQCKDGSRMGCGMPEYLMICSASRRPIAPTAMPTCRWSSQAVVAPRQGGS